LFLLRVLGTYLSPELQEISSRQKSLAALSMVPLFRHEGNSGDGSLQLRSCESDNPGQGSARTDQLDFPAYSMGRGSGWIELEAATKANAKIQATLLRESSTVISGLVKSGSVKVVAGFYDLGTGSVTLVE
jgi:carbonic anhydrase